MSRHSASDLLLGRYRLDVPLGKGGAGEVWRARDTRLGRPVAIKVLSKRSRGAAAAVAEARTVAALANPHIVALYDFPEDEQDFYLITELVDGPSLEMVLSDGPLGSEEAAAILAPIASAVAAAHRAAVVHGDIKPANVLLGREGQVKLADFGSAAYARSTGKRDRSIEISPAYAPPEVLAGHAPTTAADLYGLGATLSRAVGGAAAGARLPKGVSAQLRTMIKELTAEAPEERPQDAEEVAEELGLIGAAVERRRFIRQVASAYGPGAIHDEEAAEEKAPAEGWSWWNAGLIAKAWPALLLGLPAGWSVARLALESDRLGVAVVVPGPRTYFAALVAAAVVAAIAWRWLWPAGLATVLLVAAALLDVSGLAWAALFAAIAGPLWFLVGRRHPNDLLSPLLVPALAILGTPLAAAPLLAKTARLRTAVLASLAGAVALPLPVGLGWFRMMGGWWLQPSIIDAGMRGPFSSHAAVLLDEVVQAYTAIPLLAAAALIPVAALVLALAARGPRWLGPVVMFAIVVAGFALAGAVANPHVWDPRFAYADLSLSLILGVVVMSAAPAPNSSASERT